MTESLLGADFLRELEALRRRLEVRGRSGASGERSSRRHGSSAEFEDHRPYTEGDDPRRIDWLAYARTGEPVIKLFRADEDVVARVLLDASASMTFGDPSKIDVAKKLGAAVGYMTLAGLERAQLVEVSARTRLHPPQRGRGGVQQFFAKIGAVEAAGPADLAKAIDTVLREASRPGLLVVVSDFFDGGPVLSALGRARAAGHDLGLVQVLAPEEVEPALEGDLLLECAEGGESVELSADAGAIEAYVLRLAGLCEELRVFARRHGATYVRARTDDALEGVIRRFVARNVD